MTDAERTQMLRDMRCAGCRRFHGDYMVTNMLWKKLARPSEWKKRLCIQCLENRCIKKLNRGLTIHDFQDVPLNDVVYFVYVMKHAKARPSQEEGED